MHMIGQALMPTPTVPGMAAEGETATGMIGNRRLVQRIPVRIALDEVPTEVTLAVGLTATVEIHSYLAKQSKGHGPG
jgi:hypothetical protein